MYFFYNSDSGSSFFISGSGSLTGKHLQLKRDSREESMAVRNEKIV